MASTTIPATFPKQDAAAPRRAALVGRGLLVAEDGRVGPTPDGRLLHRRVSEGIARLAGGLVDGVADSALLIARRVLGHIAERAHDQGQI